MAIINRKSNAYEDCQSDCVRTSVGPFNVKGIKTTKASKSEDHAKSLENIVRAYSKWRHIYSRK